MHQRPSNSDAKPASGPECSVPATGCAGMTWRPAGMFACNAASTAPLTEPTSLTIAPSATMRRDRARDIRHRADGHAQDDEIAARHRRRFRLRDFIGDAEIAHAREHRTRTRRSRRSFARDVLRARRARWTSRSARGRSGRRDRTEAREAQTPRQPCACAGSCATLREERGDRLDELAVGALRPDRDAQRVREAVDADGAHDQAVIARDIRPRPSRSGRAWSENRRGGNCRRSA